MVRTVENCIFLMVNRATLPKDQRQCHYYYVVISKWNVCDPPSVARLESLLMSLVNLLLLALVNDTVIIGMSILLGDLGLSFDVVVDFEAVSGRVGICCDSLVVGVLSKGCHKSVFAGRACCVPTASHSGTHKARVHSDGQCEIADDLVWVGLQHLLVQVVLAKEAHRATLDDR